MMSRPKVIAGKLQPPEPPLHSIDRPHVVERLSSANRVALVVAPAGYGKTEAARQWFAASDRPTAWLALDLLDHNPETFWRNLVAALRLVVPELDDEPELLLAERGPSDLTFLASLIGQIEIVGSAGAIVVDDVTRLTERSVIDGVALLIDRIGHVVRFVVVGRSDPAFPLARWRSAGWLTEVREEHLRFSHDEAISVASTFGELSVGVDAAVALNARAEGWPAGLHLALLSAVHSPDPDAMAHAVAGSDRALADYLVAEILDRLPAPERDVALGLSVLTLFDAELCAGLLGADAAPVAHELFRRRLFLTMVDHATGTMRFHHLFRDLLEHELRWRDPDRRVVLHRRAAGLLTARGDLNAAYHHLITIDDLRAACEIILPLALELADRGDIVALAQHMRSLPTALQVDDPSSAFDLSVAWFFAGDALEATRWCDRAETLMTADDPHHLVRLHATRSFLALMRGHVSTASSHVASFERLTEQVVPDSPIEVRFATIGLRVALASRRFDEARVWAERANLIDDPEAVARVMVPAISAWLEFETGDLRRATVLAAEACESANLLGARPYHGTIEALITTAWCRLAVGDLRGADDTLELVRSDIDELGWTWYRIRLGLLLAEINRLRFGPSAALEAIEDLRVSCSDEDSGDVAVWLDAAESLALIGCGRYSTAAERIERLDDGPRTRLLRARLAVSSRQRESIDTLVGDRQRWTLVEQLEADVLIAAADESPPSGGKILTAALEKGHESGWVWPFLGHGDAIDRLLRRIPIERVHPALAGALAQRWSPAARGALRRLVEPLTPRELTVLELLPTHLSYAQIGERLYLSVNTIKTNLKSTYRKLHVTSRAAAVEAGTELGLVADPNGRRPIE